ncbi:hypothetical protein V6N13_007869 [Hibiscus sabdariffa]|uniref:Uncharacterized protein n=1 Tax=Hibiscus sabdariffa TaxID=183260 RepID=A0ABR2PBM4_9ROSI
MMAMIGHELQNLSQLHNNQVKFLEYVKEMDVVFHRVLTKKFPKVTRKFPAFPDVVLTDVSHFDADDHNATSTEKENIEPVDETDAREA